MGRVRHWGFEEAFSFPNNADRVFSNWAKLLISVQPPVKINVNSRFQRILRNLHQSYPAKYERAMKRKEEATWISNYFWNGRNWKENWRSSWFPTSQNALELLDGKKLARGRFAVGGWQE